MTRLVQRLSHMTELPFSPSRMALLLDFDGTLVDIAPTPDSVVVPAGLVDDLLCLKKRLGGALAIITGRPIAQIDHFLPGIPHAVAGEHGVALRRAPDVAAVHASLPEIHAAWLEEADETAARYPGVHVERKRAGLVFHYRGAPGAEQALREMTSRWGVERYGFGVQAAKMALELRPDGVDKGQAVRRVMEEMPFRGRLPVFVGDDVTDMDGVLAARELGGAGWLIPDDFPDAASFREWLHKLAEDKRWNV